MIVIESQIFHKKKNVFFDFNLKISINTLYYLFLITLKSQIIIIKKKNQFEISVIDIKFTIIFISHFISDILIINNLDI